MKLAKHILAIFLLFPFRGIAASHIEDNYNRSIIRLDSATNEVERFRALGLAAMSSINMGKTEDAKHYLAELSRLLPQNTTDRTYGSALHYEHLVYGRIALLTGNIEEAKAQLLEAGQTPGSPVLDSFGPNMTLAKELLERGATEAVLDYFKLCTKFWSGDFGKLKRWESEVRNGQMPDFGANMYY